MQKDIATIRIACNNKIPAVSTDDRTTFLELLEKQQTKFDKISQSVISNQTAGCNVLVNNISSPVKKSKYKRKKRRNIKTDSSSSSDSSDSSTSINTSDSDYENNYDRRKHTRSRSSSDKRKNSKSKKRNSHRKSRREDVSRSHAYDVGKSDNTSTNMVHMWQNQLPHHFLHQPNEIPHAGIALQHPMAINMPQEQFVPLPNISNINFIPQPQLPNNQFQESKEQGHNLTLEALADAAGNLQH